MPINLDQPNYQILRKHYAERRREIVFWVGAGASADSGLPVWPVLRNQLINQALETASTMDAGDAKKIENTLELAKIEPNLWDAFQSIKDALGRTDFRELIKHVFTDTSNLSVPDIYNFIWKLKNISGVLSFNIDGFVSRSHKEERPKEEIITATGKNILDYMSAISNGKPFIAELHGHKDAPSSWVFTRNEIEALINTEAYKKFIEYIFMSRTVIFIGISADDVAAGSFLQSLAAIGLDFGPHFWITDRRDAHTHAWAQRGGVQLVRYQPDTGADGKPSHSTVLEVLFKDLQNFVSRDRKPSAVIPPTESKDAIPTVQDLRRMDDDDARQLLTAYAKNILNNNNDDTNCEEYKTFLRQYSPVIHQSWHITEDEPYNKFFGYTVLSRISRSNFSNVWRVKDSNGVLSALKVIQIDNLHSGAQIDSFRRGVESLRYLTNSDVPGTPKLIDAREIPTSFIMTYIDGQNLYEIVQQKDFDFWYDALPIMINVCDHLKYSHNLPQGVLHRDVRPTNIMIPEFGWSESEAADYGIDKYKAVLLNYDMSWHVNAKGETIGGKLEESGFYAPELIESGFGSLARRTYVDSYGVGMTLYYCFTKQVPPSGGSKSTDWEVSLESKFKYLNGGQWRSAPERLKRIIIAATNPEDEQRDTINVINAKLCILKNMIKGNLPDITSDIWAEELMSRIVQTSYKTENNENYFTRELKTGRILNIKGYINREYVELNYFNTAAEHTDRSSGKLWGEKLRNAESILASSGWIIDEKTTSGGREIKLTARILVENLEKDIDKSARDVNRALDHIRLD